MIRSMTGYGQAIEELDNLRVSVDTRSVNNRFADVRLKLPTELVPLESEIRRRVLARIRRGRVELIVKLERPGMEEGRPLLNRPLIEEALSAGKVLRETYGLKGDPGVADLLMLPGMFKGEPPAESELDEPGQAALHRAVDAAVEALDRDRRREGEVLRQELQGRVRTMQELSRAIRGRTGEMALAAKEKLLERIRTLAADVELDPGRLEQEAAILADRSDVTEEMVRLGGHLEQAENLLNEPDGEPLGKRFDFLLQEIHRETNTTASKSSDLELTRNALALKAEVEKVREQVQNLE